ncbi:MAG: hypothetical protein R2746_16430 [Acidimicrobiales bacterium]
MLDAAGLACVVKTSGAKGVHVFVPVSGASLDQAAAATRAVAARAEALDPDLATTAFMKEDREGRCSWTPPAGRRHGGGGVQPAGATGCAGVVPGALGRPRRRLAAGLHHPDRALATRCGRSVAGRRAV